MTTKKRRGSTPSKTTPKKKATPTVEAALPALPDGLVESLAAYGFEIKPSKKHAKVDKQKESFVPPSNDDGSVVVDASGAFATYVDLNALAQNEYELIQKYLAMEMYPEVDAAIDDIVNAAIVGNEEKPPVSIVLDDLEGYSESIKQKIRDEFDTVLRLLNFNNDCYDLFRRWFVIGKSYYHKIIGDNPRNGIIELRYVDPRQIRKYRIVKRAPDTKTRSTATIVDVVDEFFLFNPYGIQAISLQNVNTGLRIELDSICYITSGRLDPSRKMIVSYLHPALKWYNMLQLVEDALVIYRLSRASERRIFYIDCGDLPAKKAEEYVKSIMNSYRNKLVYNPATGEVKDDRRYLSLMEDFWIPRRGGTTATNVDTLPGGEHLDEIGDILYFQKKLYKALKVPASRLDSDTGFTLGRATEITRDELKFSKFIERLRKRFTHLFDDLLKTQLVLKGIINVDDWEEMQEFIHYDFLKDNYFAELKDIEILRDRLELASRLREFEGTYFSKRYIRREILKLNEEEIIAMDKEIEEERKKEVETNKYLENEGLDSDHDNNDADNLVRLDVNKAKQKPSTTDSKKEASNEEQGDKQ